MQTSMRNPIRWLAVAALVAVAVSAPAQTTNPGPAIDLEIYNPADGSNAICAAPGDTVWARIFVRPATGGGTSIDCTIHCGGTVGGPANIASAILDLSFDRNVLAYWDSFNNPDAAFAAVDGLIQEQNLDQGRIGWALAGDWTPDGDTSGSLADPCTMLKIDQLGWLVEIGFNVLDRGEVELLFRDSPEFAMSLADVCGSEAFTTANGGIDEVIGATVSTECPATSDVLFRNGFDTGDASLWTTSIG
jgi:hypothetical protein